MYLFILLGGGQSTNDLILIRKAQRSNESFFVVERFFETVANEKRTLDREGISFGVNHFNMLISSYTDVKLRYSITVSFSETSRYTCLLCGLKSYQLDKTTDGLHQLYGIEDTNLLPKRPDLLELRRKHHSRKSTTYIINFTWSRTTFKHCPPALNNQLGILKKFVQVFRLGIKLRH